MYVFNNMYVFKIICMFMYFYIIKIICMYVYIIKIILIKQKHKNLTLRIEHDVICSKL